MSDQPTEHVAVPGDTLAALAKRYYGSEKEAYWMRIYHANAIEISHNVLGGDPSAIKPGTKLTIPPPPAPRSMFFRPIGASE